MIEKIAGIGKAGNPDNMDGVTPGMTVGAATEALAGENMILTAGGIDTHIHFISPPQFSNQNMIFQQNMNHPAYKYIFDIFRMCNLNLYAL